MPSRREVVRRVAVAVAVMTAAGLGGLAWSSTLLGEYSVMDMGAGGAGSGGHDAHAAGSAAGAAPGAGVVEV
ncbi:MAG: copper oxidase, partial [Agromyces sp.]|nr:copper oxidase [Agromyces sp.]